jgi:hypothetical protein
MPGPIPASAFQVDGSAFQVDPGQVQLLREVSEAVSIGERAEVSGSAVRGGNWCPS